MRSTQLWRCHRRFIGVTDSYERIAISFPSSTAQGRRVQQERSCGSQRDSLIQGLAEVALDVRMDVWCLDHQTRIAVYHTKVASANGTWICDCFVSRETRAKTNGQDAINPNEDS